MTALDTLLRNATAYIDEINALEANRFDPAKLLGDMVDTLGSVKAAIAKLQAQEKTLTDKLKMTGLAVIEGTLFRATISESNREVLDTKALKEALGEEIVAEYTSITPVVTCRVNAHKTSK